MAAPGVEFVLALEDFRVTARVVDTGGEEEGGWFDSEGRVLERGRAYALEVLGVDNFDLVGWKPAC
jgi:hypothetical protein